MRALILTALLLAACGGRTPPVDEPSEGTDATTGASEYPSAAPDPADEPAQAGPTSALETFEITIDQPTTSKSGIVVLLASGGHKHAVSGGSTSSYDLTLTKDGETYTERYSFDSDDPVWYMEGVAHGHLFTISELFDPYDEKEVLTSPEDIARNDMRRVTLQPTEAVPLDGDAARDRGREIVDMVLDDLGCSGDSSASALETPGTFMMTVMNDFQPVCTVLVGVYTGALVWHSQAK